MHPICVRLRILAHVCACVTNVAALLLYIGLDSPANAKSSELWEAIRGAT